MTGELEEPQGSEPSLRPRPRQRPRNAIWAVPEQPEAEGVGMPLCGETAAGRRSVREDPAGSGRTPAAENGHHPFGTSGDEGLVSLVEGGDALAFTVLYDRHVRAAYGLAYGIVGERQDAEDLVRDAFLRVWLAAGTYRAERGSVRTWVLSIVQNRGIDGLRSAVRRRAREGGEANMPRL